MNDNQKLMPDVLWHLLSEFDDFVLLEMFAEGQHAICRVLEFSPLLWCQCLIDCGCLSVRLAGQKMRWLLTIYSQLTII